jgi:hypothetical protein
MSNLLAVAKSKKRNAFCSFITLSCSTYGTEVANEEFRSVGLTKKRALNSATAPPNKRFANLPLGVHLPQNALLAYLISRRIDRA